MAEAFVDAREVLVAARVRFVQLRELRRSFARDLVAVVGLVLAAHEQRERQVAQAVEPRLVRVPRHHRRRGEAIRHTRRELPHTVAARRIAHQVHAIRIDAGGRDVALDQPLEQGVDVTLMPEVPCVGRRARRDVDALGRLVERELVRPLLIVDRGRRAAAAVHRDPQASPAQRRVAEASLAPTQLHAVELDLEGRHLRGAFALELRELHLPQPPERHARRFRVEGVARRRAAFFCSEPLLERHQPLRERRELVPAQIERRHPCHRNDAPLFAVPHTQRVALPRLELELGHVVQVRGARARDVLADDAARAIDELQRGDDALAGSVEHTHPDARLARNRRRAGVTRGDVDGGDGRVLTIPHERESEPLTLPRRGVDAVLGRVGTRLRGVGDEPTAVETRGIVLVGAGEEPAAVPDLDPRVVAAQVAPHRRADGARGDTDGATRFDEHDREAGARRFAACARLGERLVRAFAAGVIVQLEFVEEFFVQRSSGFARGRGAGDDRARELEQLGAPRVARLVEDGVGQDVVQEELLGHRGGPRELRARREREVEVRLQELQRQLAIALRHVFDEEARSALPRIAVDDPRSVDELGQRALAGANGEEQRGKHAE